MNDAQAWTVITGLLAALFAFMGLTVRMMSMTLDGKFEGLEARLDAKMEIGFGRLERRIDGLDRDVTTLTRRHLEGE